MASYSAPLNQTVELFDFDNATGIFSNQIGLATSYSQTYGLEFAPSSKILYSGSNPDNDIHQWDISSNVPATILASNTIVGSDGSSTVGSLQLAPDGKIYVAKESTSYLGVINNPDSLGNGCNYVSLGVSISPMSMGLGLPNFIASFFSPIKIEFTCLGDSTHLFLTNLDGDSAVSWNFGDPGSGVANIDTGTSVQHVFTSIDTFNVTTIEYLNGGGVDTLYIVVVIAGMPVVNIGNDTLACLGDSVILDAGNPGLAYSWSNGSSNQTTAVKDSGMYYVVVSNSGCTNTDSILVSFINCTLLSVPGFSVQDPTICEKFCTSFTDQSSNNPTAWLWTFEGASPATSTLQNPTNICYSLPGVFDVTLQTTNAYGTVSNIFPGYITVYATPAVPTISLSGLTLYSSFATTYQWQYNSIDILGATSQSYTVTQSGLYTVFVSDSHGCLSYASKNVVISGIADPEANGSFLVLQNPAAGTFTVELVNGSAAGTLSIELINTLGEIVYASLDNASGAGWSREINPGSIAAGVYFVRIKTNETSFTRKLIFNLR